VSAAAKVIDRLIGVKQTASGRWIAKCPAHEDRSPSLSVREMEDGRVLLHCFAGCPNGDVLASLGLRMADLFEKPLTHHLPPIRGGFSARELLELSAHEATVVALLASDARTRTLTADELQRLTQAAARLGKAQELAHGR
jgi:CHC2 zinc finger